MSTNDNPRSIAPSRREFLATTGALAATASAAPLVLGAEKKSGNGPVVIGEDEHTYECFHDWGELPNGHHYGGTSNGVAVDSAGMIYVTHKGAPDSMFVFDPDGKFVRSMAPKHAVDGAAYGHGIDIRSEGGEDFLYLSPNWYTTPNHPQMLWTKMTPAGETVWEKGPQEEYEPYARGAKCLPTNISFYPDGGYLLGDGYGSHVLHQYDKDDNFVRTIGGYGAEPGKFNTPHGQWLDDRDGTPRVVIADRANKRLQYVSVDGEHLGIVEGLLFPADIDIRGDVMMVPDLHARITLFDKDNNVITHLGDDPAWRNRVLTEKPGIRGRRGEWRPGRFIHPHDAAFDADGNIFVTEWVGGGRVTKLRKVS